MTRYKIKEIFLTKQGEGYHTGRKSVFIRFSGCNLWSGMEKDRDKAICNWCDTDFVGTDGLNGGKYSIDQIAKLVWDLWPANILEAPYIVCTGGEPLLQLDQFFVDEMHRNGFEIAIETNGTCIPPNKIDWICVSPKNNTDLVLKTGDELKFVYPQSNFSQQKFENLISIIFLSSQWMGLIMIGMKKCQKSLLKRIRIGNSVYKHINC